MDPVQMHVMESYYSVMGVAGRLSMVKQKAVDSALDLFEKVRAPSYEEYEASGMDRKNAIQSAKDTLIMRASEHVDDPLVFDFINLLITFLDSE